MANLLGHSESVWKHTSRCVFEDESPSPPMWTVLSLRAVVLKNEENVS